MPLEPKVLNKHKIAKMRALLPREYVGRPTIWGNPFVIGKDGTREEVIEKYEKYLLANEYLLSRIHELEGKDLVCFCAPLPCHADILLKYANKEDNNNVDTSNTKRSPQVEGTKDLTALWRIRTHFRRTTPRNEGRQALEGTPVAEENPFVTLN